jgi:glycosyltransferase involved in cell wall biosynthesis
MNAATDPERFLVLRERLRDVPGAHLLDRTLSREDVYALESVCDCVVSLHRAEGFGLTLAECMALGKPAIATGWSGNTDFMDARNACPVGYSLKPIERDVGPYRAGQTWAEPDVEHAAWYMRRLVADAELRWRLASAGRETVRRELSPIVVGERYRRRLEVLPRVL